MAVAGDVGRDVFALLVGINEYPAPIRPLRGCCNDVTRARDLLVSRTGAGLRLRPRILLNGQATRAAVIAGFREHLAKAGRDDTALFWFSGHGSQTPAPGEWQHLEPSGMLQSLVCADSRRNGVPDLLDKEVRILLAEVAASGAHVVVVLDACYSGGATRQTEALRHRYERPAAFPPDLDALLPEARLPVPSHRTHVLLAACHQREVAHEVGRPDGQRGVFSVSLLDEIAARGAGATYRELMTGTLSAVEDAVRQQTPLLFPADDDRCDQPFLGGRIRPPAATVVMRYVRGRWEIDIGACHGLSAADGRFHVGVPNSDPVLEAEVVAIETDRSVVEPIGWRPDRLREYAVVLTQVPLPPTRVAIHDDAGAVDGLVRAAAATSGAAGGPSPYLRMLTAAEVTVVPELVVRAPDNGQVTIRPADEAQTLAGPYDVVDPQSAQEVVRHLEHIARWRQIKGLTSSATRLAGAIQIEVVPARPGDVRPPPDRPPISPGDDGAVTLTYRLERDGWTAPEVFVRLRNTTNRSLYCVLLDLTDRFRIHPELFPGDWIAPHYSAWAADGDPIEFSLPPGRPVEPAASGTDWLKLIVSEAPLSSRPFMQARLGEPSERADRFGLGIQGIVDRLGRTVMFRDGSAKPRAVHDWTTSVLSVVTTVPCLVQAGRP